MYYGTPLARIAEQSITILHRSRKSPAWSWQVSRTYLIIPREPRCWPKCVPARRTAPHSTRCTGERGNAAGAHFRRNPLGTTGYYEIGSRRSGAIHSYKWLLRQQHRSPLVNSEQPVKHNAQNKTGGYRNHIGHLIDR